MMTGPCCAGEVASSRLTMRLSRVASILPPAIQVLLPKCPLCLAAWLTVVTGISFPVAGAAWLRGTIILLWVAAVAPILWCRTFGRAPADRRARIRLSHRVTRQ